MELNFKYWQLNDFKSIELKDIEYPTTDSLPIFFTNAKHISTGVQDFERATIKLQSYFKKERNYDLKIQSLSNIYLKDNSESNEEGANDNLEPSLILINNQQNIEQLSVILMKIRASLIATDSKNKKLFLINAAFYQKIQDDTKHSVLSAAYYLSTHSVLITKKNYTLIELWVGEGWLTPTIFTEQQDKKKPIFNGLWMQMINDQLYQLAKRCTKDSHDKIEERKKKYLHILEACLPYQKSRKGFFIPSHAQPWSGPFEISENGPMDAFLLSKGTRDSSYHYPIRELILEGWLTIWKKDQRYMAHTASFALLYWTARYLGKNHTNNPREFLENYELLPEDGWFGGSWKKEIINKGDNNA